METSTQQPAVIEQERVRILWNESIGSLYYRIGLRCSPGYARANPGQFVMLRPSESLSPLLRRPFSIHRLVRTADRTEGLELLYKVVGPVTQRMATLTTGDELDLLGPLGNGFRLPEVPGRIVLVAGGIGIAPLMFLALRLGEHGADLRRCRLFLGGRSREDLLCREDFERLGIVVHHTTDDGSSGDQCLVTQPFESQSLQDPPELIYACGPMDMLRCVIGVAAARGIPCQVSIETMMACGIGACLGCAVASRHSPDRYLHACLDGPVFDALDLLV
jgi:dihydroorotate dehydrogenase electron transfer subunit